MADMNQDTTTSWREEIKRLGKYYFEILDMSRLGFLKLLPEELDQLKATLQELNKVNGEINTLKKDLDGLEDITPIIKEIRRQRIERVRKQREIRKKEKEEEEAKRKEEIARRKKITPSFLGSKIAGKLKFEGAEEDKLKELGLPVLQNLQDLAGVTGFTCEEIQWLCYHRQAATIDHYNRFKIPKRKGGTRTIASPKPKMREAQQWVLENILNKIEIHDAALAFREGKSIVDNAELHKEKSVVVRIDLKDFFPSIKFHRVKGVFKSFGYNYGMATVLALLCTDAMRLGATLGDKKYFVGLGDRYVPQGSCTSPMLTNIIGRNLDNRLSKLGASMEWAYSRYADDLVFSHADKTADLKPLLGLTKKIIAEESFEINEEKTMVMRGHQRQTVTGILVNHDEIRISRRDVRNFRAFLHQYEKEGKEAMSKKIGKDATRYAKGYISFMKMVNGEQAKKFTEKYSWLEDS